MAKKITLPDSDYFYKRALALNGMPTEQPMPDPIRIPLDGPVPTESGFYAHWSPNNAAGDNLPEIVFVHRGCARMSVIGEEVSVPLPPNARWSRRIEIGGA